jgi:hypothetical protein
VLSVLSVVNVVSAADAGGAVVGEGAVAVLDALNRSLPMLPARTQVL